MHSAPMSAHFPGGQKNKPEGTLPPRGGLVLSVVMCSFPFQDKHNSLVTNTTKLPMHPPYWLEYSDNLLSRWGAERRAAWACQMHFPTDTTQKKEGKGERGDQEDKTMQLGRFLQCFLLVLGDDSALNPILKLPHQL